MCVAIIGDDLSGSSDTAVSFIHYGFRSCVINYPEGFEAEISDCDVLSVSTNTRELDGPEAAKIVREVVVVLMKMGVKNVYKKIDSTWRGNVGYEIEAIMEAMDIDIAVICSAFPEMKRTISHGHLYVDEVQLEDTPIADDPNRPVKDSFLPRLLQEQTDLQVHLIDREVVTKGPEILYDTILNVSNNKKTMILVDAVTNDDLDTVASINPHNSEKILFCGSAGMSNAMLSAGKFATVSKAPPVLVIVGSVHPQNKKMIDHTVKYGSAKEIFIDPQRFVEGMDLSDEIKKTIDLMRQGNNVIIHAYQTTEERKVARVKGFSKGLNESDISLLINKGLQKIAGEVFKDHQVAGVMVTGGSTALHFLRGVQGAGIRMIEELEVGVPYGTVIGGPLDGTGIITKAGGFGTETVMIKGIKLLQWKYLSGRNRQ